MTSTKTTPEMFGLRTEILNANDAIKAFKLGMKWLAVAELQQAPSVKWLESHKKACVRQLNNLRAKG